MQSRNSSLPYPRKPISQFDLFTGGKTADFAVYYTTAVENLDRLVDKLEKDKKPYSNLKDATYIALRNYVWKGFEFDKNSSGYSITEDDRVLFRALYEKLCKLRNFHCHVWHDNSVLEFSDSLIQFMEEKLTVAITFCRQNASSYDLEQFTKMLADYPHFYKKFITQEGRVFFLSLFLTKGQMNSFLQQRTGSKRNDLPLYKTKRDIYTYFCHNDRASVIGHHLNNAAFDDLNGSEKKEILSARQAYKIISYLNDIPEIYGDQELTPLFIKDERGIVRCESAGDLVTFCEQNNILSSLQFDKNGLINNVVIFSHPTINDYSFQLSYGHFHSVLVQMILDKERFSLLFESKLRQFSAERLRFHQFITSELSEDIAPTDANIELLRAYNIKGGPSLKILYEQWLDGYLKSRRPESKSLRLLSLRTAPNSMQAEMDKLDPIVLLSQYFFMGEEDYSPASTPEETLPKKRLQQKLRAENQFMRYAVQYLMDHQLVKDWRWQQESFIIQSIKDQETGIYKDVNKRVLIYSPVPKEGYRIAINDNQVTAAIERNEKAYKFGIGPRVMRYIIAYHILGQNKDRINGFLNILAADLETLNARALNATTNKPLALLIDPYIPEIYKKLTKDTLNQNTSNALADLKAKVIEKVNTICEHLQQKSDSRHKLLRAEKNRQIMECYLYYDWSETSDKKFLRKSEYNKMSVCHYLLHDRRKFRNVYEKMFQLKNRIPRPVDALLQANDDLDDLLKEVIRDVRKLLKSRLANTINIPNSKILKKELLTLAKTVGADIPESLLNPESAERIQTIRKESLKTLPFNVHPNLVLSFFDKQLFSQRELKPQNFFKQLQKDDFTKGLFEEHYKPDALLGIYNYQDEVWTDNKQENTEKSVTRKAKEKLIGKVNTCYYEDIMLWQIAKAYLKLGTYTSHLASDIQTSLREAMNTPTVKTLHKELVILPITKTDTTYYLQLRLHQLDNFLFMANYHRLHDAITHLCNRSVENHTAFIPPANPENAISLDMVILELQRIRLDAQKLGEYLITWEKSILHSWCEANFATDEHARQQLLKDRSLRQQSEDEAVKGLPHINFRTILEMANELNPLPDSLSTELRSVRNAVLHSIVPTDQSFKARTLLNDDAVPTPLGKLLQITVPIDAKKLYWKL